VLAHRRDAVDVIECKWDPAAFDSAALRVFRDYYPRGRNYLVTPSGDPAYTKRFGTLDVRVCTPTELRAQSMKVLLPSWPLAGANPVTFRVFGSSHPHVYTSSASPPDGGC